MRLQYILTAFVASAATFVGSAGAAIAASPEKPAAAAAMAAAAHIMSPGKLTTTKPASLAKPADAASAKSTAKVAAHPKLKPSSQKSTNQAGTVKIALKDKQPSAAGSAADATKVALAPQTVTTTPAYNASSLPSMQPLNAVVNTAPVNSSEPKTEPHPAAVTPNASTPGHPMVLTPAPAYEVAMPQEKSGKMAKLGGWFNQRLLRRGPAPSPTPPATVQAGPASYAAAAKPAASPYLIASEGASTVTYWPPTSTNVAVHNYGPMSESVSPGATTSAGIPSEMRPAILIVKLAPGIYPAAISGVIDKVHGSVMGSHGAEYMHTLRIAVNRNDVPLAMKLLTGNKAVQYVVPEELLGIAGANK